jgi:DNA-binding transcriptional ArsR family regulator
MTKTTCIRQKADLDQINHCKLTVAESLDTFEYLSNCLQLAGNSVRLKILFLLHQETQLCVCDISDILEMNISAISQHLRKLKDRDLIFTQREAQTIYYSLAPSYEAMLLPFFETLAKQKPLLEL